MKPALIYEFGGHTLDLGRRRLRHGGDDIAIRPKSLALLIYLVENPGRVIDKEELIGALWPDTIVSDDSLSQCLKDVRAALGAEAENLVRTVPRRGYIVDEGQVRCRSELPSPQSKLPSIAVLPFRPLARDREHHWFAEGLTEDIATALTRSRQLTVMSGRIAAPEVPRPAAEAAEALGVGHIVDGSVRLVGERLRVSAQLVDARSGTILWADRFDRYLSDVFAIQDEIAEAIVRHLVVELLPQEQRAIQLSRTDNMEAYTYYRHGWQLARHWTRSHLVVARRMFTRAVELDPAFARALSAIALCDCYLLEWFATDETPDSVLAIADRALALDASLAEAHVARGLAFQRSGRTEDARGAYAQALAIDPTCFEARLFSGFLAWTLGHREIAKAEFIEAAQLRRDDYLGPYFVLAAIDKADPDKVRWARLTLELAERVAILQPENPAPLSRGAIALMHLGKADLAVSWIKRALMLDPDDPITTYNAASVYSVAGDQETALRFLKIYVRQSAAGMADMIRNDDDLAGVRNHPGFREVMAAGWRPRP
ncbi:tetratricopeptide repeat protein [Mesorhizobium sp. 1M-11]|uniref:TPR end-of-group domain-containing protein n=1 Tax=Mesorhizobium sp. 1M-11 TaxID=1529006 RepID=UPI0006C73C73|nr:tetratricopeptide repeat protein [Mesorhizobium sp. 1M-11]